MTASARVQRTPDPRSAELRALDVRCLTCGERARIDVDRSPTGVLWVTCHAPRQAHERCCDQSVFAPTSQRRRGPIPLGRGSFTTVYRALGGGR